ncbi:hypothetical protein V1264_001691 [Littorina saxatilis]|uniref:Reverse transcriptase domain-containing protein n=1 Tax=Littorina saxatilis TaxID=31220 RepID=A0AAN9C2H1_9CAEN
MFRWIRGFLHERSARVKLDGHLSHSVKKRGVPQGCVVSPTLFLLYINNITTVLPRHVSNTLHAHDLAIWSAADLATSAVCRIQTALHDVHQWTEDWRLQVSEVKPQATVFSLSTTKEKVTIKLGDKTLPQVETPTFLGVKLDPRLSWKPQIEDMEKRWIKKLALVKKLSGTHWGGQLQDTEDCVHRNSSPSAGVWGKCLGNRSQDTHQQTGPGPKLWPQDNPWRHEIHSYCRNGKDSWN